MERSSTSSDSASPDLTAEADSDEQFRRDRQFWEYCDSVCNPSNEEKHIERYLREWELELYENKYVKVLLKKPTQMAHEKKTLAKYVKKIKSQLQYLGFETDYLEALENERRLNL